MQGVFPHCDPTPHYEVYTPGGITLRSEQEASAFEVCVSVLNVSREGGVVSLEEGCGWGFPAQSLIT